MSNLESDTWKQILRTYCNISEPRWGVGSKGRGVCMCVYEGKASKCVCARTCTCVLLCLALSFLSSLLGPLRQVSVTLEKGYKSFKCPHYRPALEQPLMMFKALFSH